MSRPYPPPRRRRARSSRVAYPILFLLVIFLCVGVAAASEMPGLALILPPSTPTPSALPPTLAPPPVTLLPNLTPTVPAEVVALPAPIAPTVAPTASPAPSGYFVPIVGPGTANCEGTAIRGTIMQGGLALEGVRVRVWWPEAPPDQLWSAPTGTRADLGPGRYEVMLDSQPRDGWWLVAVVDDTGAIQGESVVVQTTAGGCAEGTGRQGVQVDFQRTGGTLGVVSAALPPTTVPPPTLAPPPPPPPTPLPTPLPTPDSTERVLKVPILMYHYVSDAPPGSDRTRRDLSVGPALFRAQLYALYEQGYTTITLTQLLYAIQQGAPLPEKPVVLTFDDGYRDNYTNAFPILREFGFVGTFFVITDLVEERNNNYMTWEQLVEMQGAGMEIGSHTRSHLVLPGSDYERVWDELATSRWILEQRLGREIRTFAYPFGRFDPGVAHLARDAGYWIAVSTKAGVTHGPGNLLTLRRIRIHGAMAPESVLERIHHWMVEATREP